MRKTVNSHLPNLVFNAGTGTVLISSGRRGRVSVSGKGSLSPAEFAQFLEKLRWYSNQLTPSVPPISAPETTLMRHTRSEETTPLN